MEDTKARKMPRASDVVKHWAPVLISLGKVDAGELEKELTEKPQQGICFACGWFRPLQRCHIVARAGGGLDAVDNVHLLCRFCHQISEGLEGDAYWRWFQNQDQVACLLQMLACSHPEHARRLVRFVAQSEAQ